MALLVSVSLYYVWQLLRAGRNPWPQRFLRAAARLAGARITVRGALAPRRAVLLANHVSWLDIPVLAGATGTAFVAHSGLAGNGLARRLCAMNGTVFVARAERARIAEQVEEVRAALSDRGCLTIFPEGTTSDRLLPFKSALLSAVDPPPPGLAVQPVWVDYGAARGEAAWIGESGLANAVRILGRKDPLPVTLHLLEPFDPAQVGSRKAIAREARERIEAAMRAAGHLPG